MFRAILVFFRRWFATTGAVHRRERSFKRVSFVRAAARRGEERGARVGQSCSHKRGPLHGVVG
eukprot:11602740-Alexandrium_andersonii.AAC.1